MWPVNEADTHLHVVPTLRMCGALLCFPYTFLRCVGTSLSFNIKEVDCEDVNQILVSSSGRRFLILIVMNLYVQQ